MLTVQGFLELPGNAVTPVVLPRPDVPIRWVAGSELADPGEFLGGGELLLTTGLVAHEWGDEAWDRYVAGLVHSGVSAVGFGVHVAFNQIPRGLIQACVEHQLNLLSVPEDVAFVSISRRVAELLMSADPLAAPQEHGRLMVQQELGRAAAKGSESAILRTIASAFKGTAALHHPDGEVRIGPVGVLPGTYPLMLVARAIEDSRARERRGSATIREGDLHISINPLGLGGTVEGFLTLVYRERPEQWQRSALNLAVSLLQVTARSASSQLHVFIQNVSTVGRLLAAGHDGAARIVADQFGLAVPSRLQVALLQPVGPTTALEAELEAGVKKWRRSPDHNRLVCWFDDGSRIVLMGREGFTHDLVALGQHRVGLSRAGAVASAALTEATAALERTDRSRPVVSFHELAGQSLSDLVPADLAREFAARHLAGVTDDPRLLETLRAYLEGGGSVAAAAKILGLHRNSVIYRLGRLRAVLEEDLDDPRVRVNLWAALEMIGVL